MAKRAKHFNSSIGEYYISDATNKFTKEGITYRRIDNNVQLEVEVTSNSNSDNKYTGDIVIPSTVEFAGKDYTVTRIGNSAFSECRALSSISLPKTITSIGSQAFYYCQGLTDLEIPNSVQTIEYRAFYYCNSLKTLVLSNALTSLGNEAFSSCSSLQDVELPSTLESINYGAFADCRSLKYNLVIPGNVSSIGGHAFRGCSSLPSITFSEGLETIGENSFSGCTLLSSITLPQSLKTIGDYAFNGCTGLLSVTISEGTQEIKAYAFSGCSNLTTLSLPNTLTTIGDYAFNACQAITTLQLPENLTSLGRMAFQNCSSIQKIIALPETPPTMVKEYHAFPDLIGQGDKVTLYVKSAAAEAYRNDENWCQFDTRKSLENVPSAQPTFAFDGTTYLLTISSPEAGAKIYFTRDGSEPTTESEEYTVPIRFMQNGTIKAIAVSGDLDASLISEYNKEDFKVTIPTATINDETFVVTLNSGEPDIEGFSQTKYYYSLRNNYWDGVNESDMELIEGNTIQMEKPYYVFVRAERDGWNNSELARIDFKTNYSTTQPSAEWDSENMKVRIYGYDEDATVYYTLDGSTPTTESAVYDADKQIVLDHDATVTCVAVRPRHFNSELRVLPVTGVTTKFSDVATGYYFQRIDGNMADEVEITFNPNTEVKYSGDVVIPEEVEYREKKYKVTRIGNQAFSGCGELTSVTIPETVTSIGTYAFSSTGSNFTKIVIPASVTTIENYAFQWSRLKEVTLSEGLQSIGQSAFNNCDYLTDINLPSSLTSIGNSAFYSCDALVSIVIPNSITELGEYAFAYCSKLSSVTLSTSMTSISREAFRNTGLRSITIPEGVTTIGNNAFSSCSSLTTVSLPSTLTSMAGYAFFGCSSLVTINLPSSLINMGEYAFSDCSALASVSIPEGITALSNYLFNNCTGLATVAFSANLTTIGYRTFQNCKSLRAITLPASLTELGEYAFQGCTSLESIYALPTTPPNLNGGTGETAFADLLNTAVVYVNSTDVETAYTQDLKWQRFDKIEVFDQSPVAQPTFLFNIDTYTLTISSLDADATIFFTRDGSEPTVNSEKYEAPIPFMQNCTVKAVAVNGDSKNSLISEFHKEDFKVATPTAIIDDETFVVSLNSGEPDIEGFPQTKYYYSLRNNYWDGVNESDMELIEGNTIQMEKPYYVFVRAERDGWNNSELARIDFKTNYSTTTPQFEWNSETMKMRISGYDEDATVYYTLDGSTPTTESAVYDAENQIDIDHNCTVTCVAIRPKHFHSELNSYNVSNATTKFTVGDFTYQRIDSNMADEVEITYNPNGDVKYSGEVVIPSEVTYRDKTYKVVRIGNSAFSGCGNLTSVTIPETVTSIGSYAFSSTGNGFTKLDIPASVMSIEEYAFNWSNLREVNLPEGFTSISPNTFYECNNLTDITLPSSLTSIGSRAFYSCDGLRSIVIPNNVTELGDNAFRDCRNLSSVTLSTGLTSISREAFRYTGLTGVKFHEGLTSIDYAAFANCSSLVSVSLPSTLTSFGENAFNNCSALASISIPESVTALNNYVFSGCSGISTVSLPNTLTTIGYRTFGDCRSLRTITLPASVTELGEYAFQGCSGLESIYALSATPPNLKGGTGESSFADLFNTTVLYVNGTAKQAYVDDVKWSKFNTIEAFEQQMCAQPTFVLENYKLTITTTTAGATIRYTTDGSDPTAESTAYEAPLTFIQNGTIKAIAVAEGYTQSYVSEFNKDNYQVPLPVATMDDDFKVTLTCEAPETENFPETTIYYAYNSDSWNGDYNNTSYWEWKQYDGQPVQLDKPGYMHLCAMRDGWLMSSTTICNFYSSYKTTRPSMEWNSETMKMRIYGYDEDATVYYTLDGSTPTTESAVYDAEKQIELDHNATVTCIAMRPGHFNSETNSKRVEGLTIKFTEGDLTFQRIDGNMADEVEITFNSDDTKKYVGDIAIPSTVTYGDKTYTVIRIGNSAFSGCRELTSVTIPETVTSIGTYAFSSTGEQFTQLDIPTNVTTIEEWAFQNSYIKKITLPEGYKSIGANVFRDCNYLTDITLPSTLTTIGDYAFFSCDRLINVVIPNSVTELGEYAFRDCNKLASVTLSNSLTSISREAFRNTGLRSITIPEGVTTIGNSAFLNCSSLMNVQLPSTLTNMDEYAFSNCNSLTAIGIPESIKALGNYVFAYCWGLTTVSLPGTLTSIGERTFTGCGTLRSITLPESLTELGKYAFADCKALESIYALPTTPPTLKGEQSEAAFADVINTAVLYVKGTAKEAYLDHLRWKLFKTIDTFDKDPAAQPTFAFDVNNYTLAITSLDADATIYFTRDGSEPTIESEKYTTPIPFMQNGTVKAIAVNSSEIPSLVSEFRKEDLTVDTPTGSIDDQTFVVTLSSGEPDIDGFPQTKYYYCLRDNSYDWQISESDWQLLEGNTIQLDRPRYIHMYAEREGWGTSNKTYVNFYSNYRQDWPSIDYDYDTHVITMSHSNAEETGSTIYYTLDGTDPTKDNGLVYTEEFTLDRNMLIKAVCVADKHFNSDISSRQVSNIEKKFSVSGIYYRLRDNTTANEVVVAQVPDGVSAYSGDVVIPDTITYNEQEYLVTGIYSNAFNSSKIKSIVLPNSLRTIDNNAFRYCYSLSEIDLPNSVEEIGSEAFYNCNGLKKVTLPEGLKTIRSGAFEYCGELANINLPSTLTTIERSVFYGCSSLTAIDWPAAITTIESQMFNGCRSLNHINIPSTVTAINESAFYGCSSLQSVQLPDGLTILDSNVFRDCSMLTSITIPTGIKTISEGIFRGCSSLVSVLLPSEVTTIGENAFNGCSSLASITLPASLKNIGSIAFYQCTSLASINALPMNPPTVTDKGGMENLYGTTVLYVNPAVIDAYRGADGWNGFKNISEYTQPTVEQPTFALLNYKLSIQSITAGATIYYTLDGSDPTTQSQQYTSPFVFAQNGTVRAMAVADGMTNSQIAEFKKEDYRVAQPHATLDANTMLVTITCDDDNAEGVPETKIWYALSNKSWNVSDNDFVPYDGNPIELTTASYIHMYAERDGWLTSDRRYDDFYSNYNLNRPDMSWDSENMLMTLTQSDADAIYYTLDGSNPSEENGTKYSEPFTLSRNLIVKAVAVKEKRFNSEISSYAVTGIDTGFMFEGLAYCLVDNTIEDVVEVTSGGNLSGEVTVPETVTTSDGKSYTVVRIGNGSFNGEDDVTKVTLPKTISSIGNNAFSGCSQLTDINLPEALIEIGSEAFYRANLSSIVVPGGVKKLSFRAFMDNKYAKSVIIKDGVEEIGEAAFAYVGMSTLELPSTLAKIGSAAFNGCNNLTSVNIPDGVTEIESYAFQSCNSMTSASLPQSLIRISYSAFNDCRNLASIVLPESLKKIDDNAFAGCVSLNHVYAMPLTPPTIDEGTSPFTDVAGHATLYVKPLSKEAYSSARYWGAFKEIVTFENLPAEQPAFIFENYHLAMLSQTEGVSIYYTTDGTEPTTSSPLYKEPLPIAQNDTIKAMAIGENWGRSLTAEWKKSDYQVSTPKATISDDLTVTITCEEPAVEGLPATRIYYSLNRSSWNGGSTEDWILYTEPLKLTVANWLHVRAERDGWQASGQSDYDYYSNYYLVQPSISPSNTWDIPEDSTITITHNDADAKLYYTLDGSDPNMNGILYTKPFNPNQNVKVKAIAKRAGHINSDPSEREYNWFTVKTPRITFNGKFASIETETPGTAIYYTLDNSAPDTKSKPYVESFSLPAEQTIIKAIAVRENWNNSSVAERTYNQGNNYCEAPTITRVSGTDQVQMTTRTEGATIYYTIDGTMPTTSSLVYDGKPVTLTQNSTVTAMATQPILYDSETSAFTANWFRVDQPVIASEGITVTISCAKEGANIYYTLDGTDPTENSQLYTRTIVMTGSATIKAMAAYDNFNNSAIARMDYREADNATAAPLFSRNGNTVTITSSSGEGTTIYYTTDGSEPSTASKLYEQAFEVTENQTVKAIAMNPKLFTSEVTTFTVDWFKVATPVLTLLGSTLTMSCATEDATIYYSYGMEAPTTSSEVYNGAISLVDNRPVQAIAVRRNYHNSEVANVEPTYFVCESVTFSYNGRYLEMSTAEGSAIHYTLDGSRPTEDSETYTGQLDISKLCTVKAVATRRDFRNSQETEYKVSYVYNGEEASVEQPGHLEEVFQWVGSTANIETLPVSGTINNTDLKFIRSLGNLRHLDLSKATFEGDVLPDEAFAGMPLLSFSSPSQLKSAGEHLFKGCDNLAAIVWNANIAVPGSVIDDIKANPNFLLYVNSRIHVPSNYTGNVISGGQATSITLSDASSGNFCCPQRFYTQRISYTHTYSQTTESGVTCGWETLALPFDVQTITHERRGALAPFAAQEDYSVYKPFWLYELRETGFSEATGVKAYTPYIISMPNNPNYADDYILAGKVTFSAADTYIESDTALVTMKGSVRFAPTMQRQEKSANVLAINLEDFYDEGGIFYRSGSAFLPNMRQVRPFEAYALVSSSAPKLLLDELLWGEITDMRNAQMSEFEKLGRHGGVYDLSGRKLSNDSQFLKHNGKKMKRVYIVNGKKTVVE